ncbi:MAG: ATP-binding cassette domain-containing protein, partial [Bacilli bacterium]|nr:ATP-binding cassette domain-containing protein [Bacilli bacterium]
MEIEFKNVSYVYNLNTPLRKLALEEINLKFKEGKINVIMGKSGSGKTTLAQLINALLKPTRGKIEIDDFVIERNLKMKNINDLRVNVGFVFQFPEEQIFNKTVKKEIVF